MAAAEMGAFSSPSPLPSPPFPSPPSPFPPPPPPPEFPPPESASAPASPARDDLGAKRRARRGILRWASLRSTAMPPLFLRGGRATERGEEAAAAGVVGIGNRGASPRCLETTPGLAPPTHARAKACACISAQRGSAREGRRGRELWKGPPSSGIPGEIREVRERETTDREKMEERKKKRVIFLLFLTRTRKKNSLPLSLFHSVRMMM